MLHAGGNVLGVAKRSLMARETSSISPGHES